MLPERRGDFVEDVTFDGVQIDKVKVGPASDFKDTINNNFKKVKTEVDSIGNKIVVSNEKPTPTDQINGDVWISPV